MNFLIGIILAVAILTPQAAAASNWLDHGGEG
jgi:hypothetical protein